MSRKSLYKNVDELPDLVAKKEYQSVDELPDLKKKVGGVSATGSAEFGNPTKAIPSNGKAQSLSVEKVTPPQQSNNPFTTGGQYNNPQTDIEGLNLSGTTKPIDDAYIAPLTQRLKPLPTIQKVDKTLVKNNPNEIEIKEGIDLQTKHKQDIETAIENTAKNVLKMKGFDNKQGEEMFGSAVRNVLRKKYEGGSLTYEYDRKNEKPGLSRSIGWMEALSNSFNNSLIDEAEAATFDQMDTNQKVAYANKKLSEIKPTPFVSERNSGAADVAEMIGGTAPYLIKAGAAAATAAALTALAPETGGMSLTGLAPVLTVLFTAEDMINQGAKNEVMERYQKIKSENPNMDDFAAMRMAEGGGLSGKLQGAIQSVAYTTSLKLPIAKDSKNVLTKYVKNTASSAIHLGGIMAGTKALSLVARNADGEEIPMDKAVKEVANSFSEGATAGAILTGLVQGFHVLPKVVKSAFKYSLKDTPIEEIKTALKANEDIGRLPEGTAETVTRDIEGYNRALAKTDPNLSPETQASVAGLIQARDKMVEQSNKLDPTQRSGYDKNIEAINEKIKKITETNKPFEHEVDDITGDPIKEDKPTIESAVIEINGKMYEGKNHAEAILKAKEDGQDISQVDRKGQGKFKLSDGTIIDRAEAKKRFGQDRSELLIEQDNAANNANKEYRKITDTTELPTLSEPIDSTNNKGIPLEENMGQPEDKGEATALPTGNEGVVSDDVMKGVNDKMKLTGLEMEFGGKGLRKDTLSFKSDDVEIVIAKPLGMEQYQVTVSEKSNSNTGYTMNEGKTKLFDSKLEALEYAKEQKEKSLSNNKEADKVVDGSVGVGGDVESTTNVLNETQKSNPTVWQKIKDAFNNVVGKVKEGIKNTQDYLKQSVGTQYEELGKALQPYLAKIETEIHDKLKDQWGIGTWGGLFENGKIKIGKNEDLQTFFHEALHSVTSSKIKILEAFDLYNKVLKEGGMPEKTLQEMGMNLSENDITAIRNLQRIFEESKVKLAAKKIKVTGKHGYYGFNNVHEFISEAFTNPEFQRLLKELPSEGNHPTIFKAFLDAIAKLIGIKDPTILEDIFHHTEKLLDKPKSENESIADLYHQSKKNNTNHDFVKAVEQSLKVTPKADKVGEENKTNDNGKPKTEKEKVSTTIPPKKTVEGDTVGNEPVPPTKGTDTKKPITKNIPSTEGGVNTAEGEGGGKPPKEPVVGKEGGERLGNKALANRLVNAKNIPEAAKKGIEAEGLEYEPQSQTEANELAKTIIDEVGIDEAVAQAQMGKFGGDVNTLVQTEALNRLGDMSEKATNAEERLAHDLKFAEIGIALDKDLRKKGQGISAINQFYKKSPLGVQIIENVKRKADFDTWSKPKDKSWREFFEEMKKEPEFDAIVKEQVSEGMKQERAEARKARIKKVDDFFDSAKSKFKDSGAMYSTVIPPKLITAALDGMQKAYHAGEKVAKVIEDAVAYISKELGSASWDKDKFRKEWEEKLKDKSEKKPLSDEEVKAKILDRFRNKLKGLSDRQKEDVVRKSFQKIVESGGLDYADFRQIIADVTGRGEMTDAEAIKLKELVKQTNLIDEAQKRALTERTPEALAAFRKAELNAGIATRELNTLLYNRPNITKRLTSMMQLNTLGLAALVNNPIYNVWNQTTLRTPVGVVRTLVEKGIQGVYKAMGKEYLPEMDITSPKVQKEFFNKLGLGTREAVGQFLTGLNRMDYLQKEIHGQQIRPRTAMKDLWAYSKGEKNLTKTQVVDKLLQASPSGIAAEVVARVLNLGDKPQRFAAEGAQAAAFAKALGLKDIDYKLFIEFPREEAYRVYKAKGLSDAEAAKKADYIKDTIIKEGQRSTFQQDNMLNDVLTKVFGGEQSGLGSMAKSVVISPYIKIPSNAYWSYYNLINPEVALLQSMIYGGKAAAKKYGGVKRFIGDSEKTSAEKDLHEAKYWFAHAAVGIATRAVVVSLVSAGIFRPGNTQDDTKKEREGEQYYEPQGTINLSKLAAWMKGEDPSKVKNGLVLQNKWFGHWGTIGNAIARKNEDMTPEQKEKQDEFWNIAMGGLEMDALKDLNQGVFGNTSSLLSALNNNGNGLQAWGVNTVNMFANVIQPATYAQISRAELPYYTKRKADDFLGELKNSMLDRSSVVRKLTGQYPPSKVGIWGDKLDKKDNTIMRMFGISRTNDDNFAQPIYEDYKKTNNTKFFPPAVRPEIEDNGVTLKLPTKDAARLEELVGQQRRRLVAPYINDMATFEGENKTYSKLSNDEKTDNLRILYDEGFKNGKYLFLKENPKYIIPEKTKQQKQEDKKESADNKKLRESLKRKSPIPQ